MKMKDEDKSLIAFILHPLSFILFLTTYFDHRSPDNFVAKLVAFLIYSRDVFFVTFAILIFLDSFVNTRIKFLAFGRNFGYHFLIEQSFQLLFNQGNTVDPG